MSLAPVAYLLYQNVMRARPADPHWLGPRPVRAVLRALQPHPVHPALPRRLRPGARRPQGAAHLGLADPGPPRVTTPRASRSPPARSARASATAVGMAMAAAPRARPARPRRRARARAPFDHHVYVHRLRRRPRGGRQPPRRPRSPGTSSSATSPSIYDDNQISIEDDTDIAFTEDVAARYEAYGWHVADVDWTQRRRRRRLRRGRRRAARGARARPSGHATKPSLIVPAHRSSPGRPRPRRTPARRTAPRSAPTRSRPPRSCSASTRSRPSRSTATSSRTPARSSTRGKAAHAGVGQAVRRVAQGQRRTAPPCSTGSSTRTPARRLGRRRCRSSRPTPKGVATRAASGKVLNALAAELPELWGGSADLAESNNTTIEGEPSFIPDGRQTQRVEGRPLRPHAALRHPRARHGRDPQRHRAARPDPRPTAARSSSSPTTCAPRCGSPR